MHRSPKWSVPFRFSDKFLYASLIFPMILHALPISSSWFDHPNNIWWTVKVSLLQLPDTSSPLGPRILLSTLFSDTLELFYFLSVRDQVSHPYK
jgi:hypothetical protein